MQCADTDDPVYMRLSGSKGQTDWKLLYTGKHGLLRGYKQQFYVTTDDVGTVSKLELRISGYNGWDMWRVSL